MLGLEPLSWPRKAPQASPEADIWASELSWPGSPSPAVGPVLPSHCPHFAAVLTHSSLARRPAGAWPPVSLRLRTVAAASVCQALSQLSSTSCATAAHVCLSDYAAAVYQKLCHSCRSYLSVVSVYQELFRLSVTSCVGGRSCCGGRKRRSQV